MTHTPTSPAEFEREDQVNTATPQDPRGVDEVDGPPALRRAARPQKENAS